MEGQSRTSISMLPRIDLKNGGMKSAGRSLGSLGWIKVKNALGNGLLKFQAKPSVKGPEWNPKVRPLDANGRPIHYHQDDILHSLMYPNGRPQIPQIPVKYQIRPIPQQPPSPQNIRPIPQQPPNYSILVKSIPY